MTIRVLFSIDAFNMTDGTRESKSMLLRLDFNHGVKLKFPEPGDRAALDFIRYGPKVCC